MANSFNGNIFYADTASVSIDEKNLKVKGIIVYPTHATNDAIVELDRNNSARSFPDTLHLIVRNEDGSKHYDFSATPLLYPEGIRITTLTDAKIMIILDKSRG